MPNEDSSQEPDQKSGKDFLRLSDDTLLEIIDAPEKPKRKSRKRSSGYLGYRVRAALPLIVAVVVALGLGFGGALLLLQRQNVSAPSVPTVVGSVISPLPIRPTPIAVSDASFTDAQSLLLASDAQKALDNNDTDLAIRLALEANQLSQPYIQVQQALFASAYSSGSVALLPGIQNNVVIDLAVSPDGRWLAASYWVDDVLRLWDIQTRSVVRDFDMEGLGQELNFQAIAFSPDGSTLVAGGRSIKTPNIIIPTMAMWDVATGKQIRQLVGHKAPISAVTFSPDGRYILSGSGPTNDLTDTSIRVWDVKTGEQIREFDEHTGTVTALVFNATGSEFLSASWDGRLILWETESGKIIQEYSAGEDLITSADLSPDAKYALSGGFKQTVNLWDLTTDQVISQFVKQSDKISSVAFSPNDHYAASASWDRSVSLIDLSTQNEVSHFEGHTNRVTSIAFTPDNRYLFSGDEAGNIRMWSVGSNARIAAYYYDSGVKSIDLSPDEKTVLVGLENGSLLLQEVVTGQILRRFEAGRNAVMSVAFSPDGTKAISGTDYSERNLILWNLETGEEILRLQGENAKGLPKSLNFSPDGKMILDQGLGGRIVLWDAETGQQLKVFEKPGYMGIEDAYFSADGSKILAALQKDVMTLWDVNSGELLKEFQRPDINNLMSVTFSPDEQTALGGYMDGTIILWDMNSGQEIRRFKGQDGEIARMVFTPNGHYIISSSESTHHNLILWDVATGEQLYLFPGFEGWVNDLKISADGSTLYAASSNGSLQKWYIPQTLDDLKGWAAQNHYLRDFTCEEREQYRIMPLCQ